MKRKGSAGYQIAAVARLTGLSADTIRAWERRHGVVRPLRDESGIRRYRKAEIVRLQRAREATEKGHPIRIVATMDDEELVALLERGTPAPATDISTGQSIVETIVSALRDYDAQRARRTVRNASLLIEPRELILDVFVPLMHEVGRLWSEGEVSVWQEHLLSEVVNSAMGTIGAQSDGHRRKIFLFATPPGELHAFGIAFSAIVAASERFQVHNLGPNIPAAEVVQAATRLRAKTVVIGAPRSSHPAAAAFFQHLERNLPSKVELCIGGPLDFATVTARAHHIPTLAQFADSLAMRR